MTTQLEDQLYNALRALYAEREDTRRIDELDLQVAAALTEYDRTKKEEQ